MLSPMERKKVGFPLLTSSAVELKKYVDVYGLFIETGYTTELCDAYSDAFIDNAKKPSSFDFIQLASFYDKIMDHKSAYFYLDKLSERKLSGEERFDYCTGMLRSISKIGNWRDAEDFRTANISFLQKMSSKVSQKKEAELYIALALADCAAKNYTQALKLLKFGYKPQGKNDVTLLEIFITAVYIFARSGDSVGLEGALGNAEGCLKLFKKFDFSWEEAFYRDRVDNAAKGIL
ncbi:MAG: hypothetical protein J6U00_13925 [Ruminococcus sp.]|uniref:hypothetical protein n=1 Tax=Ruminococcus sp. TaxID=41978 RepID=UPI001B18E73F|nr:hypothetical protein [Ruminococcus sp.]MBO7475071.1 hypothetical protein [Ruminococcus sp.]